MATNVRAAAGVYRARSRCIIIDLELRNKSCTEDGISSPGRLLG